jgi:hypothetical protein
LPRLELARAGRLLSDEHFSVDGTLIQAWAGQKSFVRKGTTPPPPDDPGNPTINFHGEKRSNATHASITDSDALLFKKAKGHEAKLSYLGHVLIENRHGLVAERRPIRGRRRDTDTDGIGLPTVRPTEEVEDVRPPLSVPVGDSR